MERAATHLTQGYTITAVSVQEAIALQAANNAIASREGRVVTFRRSSWVRNLGTKPPPTKSVAPIVARDAEFR